MSFFSWLANGLGTLMGVVTDVVSAVVETVRSAYNDFAGRGGAVKDAAADESRRRRQRLRVVNDEIMFLRNRAQSRGSLSDQERRRWQNLREERNELMGQLGQAQEVKAAEKILNNEASLGKVDVGLHTTHIIQYNAFADTLGKKCPACARKMKLQWRRDLTVPAPKDFYWGCTGWYVLKGEVRACKHTEPLQPADFKLMADVSAPEFSLKADEFGDILTDAGTVEIITTRVDDLRSDLSRRKQGVELVTCPVHGEHMVLRKKTDATGLLDAYFLACPHWLPNGGQGCSFIEKLKSGSQLAALLKSETGRGIL